MGVLKTLRDTVAPELNHLYVQDPSEASGALDYRWRGREHALHAFLIARLFGSPAELCTGDFAVLSRRVPALSALGKDAQHAWCRIGGVAPVDLSVTFRPLPQAPQLHAAVTGEGRNGAWQVTYADDEAVLDEDIGGENEIIFIEKAVLPHSAADLLGNPYLLLPPPSPDDAGSWHALYGPGIYAKITAHCFGCATRQAKSVRQRLKPADAVAWIAENVKDAEAKILAGIK